MCGIFALLNNDNCFTQEFINEQFSKGKGRGPEFSVMTNVLMHAQFGFHRLAINGLNQESNQPLYNGDVALICNGEIYNYKELYALMDVEPNTESDCEVILHLYKKYGIEQTLQLLDGVFSFLLIDYRLENENAKIYVARDPYGVRPLYTLKTSKIVNSSTSYKNIFGFASEMKQLSELHMKDNESKIEQFPPGTYSVYKLETTVSASWIVENENIRYHSTGFSSNLYDDDHSEHKEIMTKIQYYLTKAIFKRCVTTERPIACLLSGGLDSSLITGLVNEYHKVHGLPAIETYSIGLADSEDLRHAKMVADYLGTKHTEIILTEQDFLDAIPHVIQSIESYDTTSVRASIGNWLLGKYIAENSEAKVIFNGDGSDELTGGYLYMNKAPDSIEFDRECRRLLKDIYAFDVLRSDKSISSHGLEPRTPFLDRHWVQYYLTIPMEVRNHNIDKTGEKFLLRSAFSHEYYQNIEGGSLLPDAILWRKKEAFSDGVSKTSRSLYEIIQEYTEKWFKDEHDIDLSSVENKENVIATICKKNPAMVGVDGYLVPKTSEQYYYRSIFERFYSGLGRIVPYFWMPRYVNATDASARTLELYSNDETTIQTSSA